MTQTLCDFCRETGSETSPVTRLLLADRSLMSTHRFREAAGTLTYDARQDIWGFDICPECLELLVHTVRPRESEQAEHVA